MHYCQGHHVTLFNRGKTALKKLPKENEAEFEQRKANTRFIQGNRLSADDLKSKLQSEKFEVVYDMNGREATDTIPLIDAIKGSHLEHFVYMSSAGVYKKSSILPHREVSYYYYSYTVFLFHIIYYIYIYVREMQKMIKVVIKVN
jgi:nucleoside-diphosphate-sugar epimerase